MTADLWLGFIAGFLLGTVTAGAALMMLAAWHERPAMPVVHGVNDWSDDEVDDWLDVDLDDGEGDYLNEMAILKWSGHL